MKAVERWHSERLRQQLTMVRWGVVGVPVLVFATAGGDAEEIERFHLVDSLSGLLSDGRIKVYSVDSISGRSWLRGDDPQHAMWLQKQFNDALIYEVVPAIHADCGSRLPIVTAGASIGAFWAVQMLCHRPDLFQTAIGMSGSYDLSDWLQGHWSDDFYFTSPMLYLPSLDGEILNTLQRRFVLLACGSGRWEHPGSTWRMADLLGSRGIPNRVDQWGREWDHDWPTWRAMLPQYVDELT